MLNKGEKSSEFMIQTEPPIPTVAAPSAPPLPLSPPWIELPDELTANILQRLDVEVILLIAQNVCATWWNVCKNPSMWRVIDFYRARCTGYNSDKIGRCAVDRSHGQLLHLKLSGFRVDDLLTYAAHRSSQLRSLTLDVYRVSETVLTEAIEKFTQLEELHLSMMPSLNPQDFESICISCRKLKSFTFSNHLGDAHPAEFSEHAVAIGENLANLCHLRLVKLQIENKGLEAILDGCTSLESLHLQKCSGLDLQGDLGKRSSDQIKDLILDIKPSQSERDQVDYDWYDDDESTASDSDYSGYGYDPDFY